MSKPSSKPSKIKIQDEPFDLDAIEKEASKHDYRFRLGGREWSMTPLGRLDKKDMKRIAKRGQADDEASNLDFMDDMLRAAMGEEMFAEFDELPLSQDGLTRLFEDWSEHSGVSEGESEASTSS